MNFDTLYQHYRKPLYLFILRMVKHPEIAEDLLQTTWLKVWQALPTAQEHAINKWLYQIARNTAIDELRRFKLRMTRGEALSYDAIDFDMEDSRDFTEGVCQREEIGRAWQRLSAQKRRDLSTWLQCEGRGLSTAQRMASSRARGVFRQAMEKEKSA